MAPLARGRPSTSTVTTSPAQPAPRPLPRYQQPAHPLTAQNQRSLSALTSAVSSSASTAAKLKEHLKSANEILGEVADNINEMATLQTERVKQKKARDKIAGTATIAGDDDEEGTAGDEEGIGELGRKVDGLTTEIEEMVRELIDARGRVDAREKALSEVTARVGNGLGGGTAGGGTQSTLGASQLRKGDGEREDEEEENHAEPGVPALLKEKMDRWEGNYGAMSMREKYATHNDYISFKKSLHYGLHANTDNPPPIPHSNTWFRSGSDGVEGPHSLFHRHTSTNQAEDEDEGSDIEAVAASINIKCPITLLPMKDPVTSKKCPHSFEKEAIEEMIGHSSTQVGGSGRQGIIDGTRALRCPVCSVLLTSADLVPDPVLRRNIQRIVAAEEARNNRDEEDEDDAPHNSRSQQKRAHSVDSNYKGEQRLAPQVKAEKVRSSMMRSSIVPSTQLGESGAAQDEDLEMDDNEDYRRVPRMSMSTGETVDLGEEHSDEDDDE